MNMIISRQTDPYTNLATEETLYNQLQEDILFLWRNTSSVIIGKNQEVLAEVDTAYARNNDIKIARRITGGGAVYHDLGNVNISYIFTCNDENFDDKVGQFLRTFIAYLQSIDLNPILTGRNDICVRDRQGNLRKISGTAMTQKGNRGLFHLCLLFDVDMDMMEKVLTPPAEKLASKGVASVRSRTINVKNLHPQLNALSADAFFDQTATWFSRQGETSRIPEELTSSIDDIKNSRYANEKWTYNRKYRKENSSCMKLY